MAEKHVFLSLSPNRATAESGWYRRPGPYDDQYIEQIVDPSDAVPKRLLTAIPSPFARIHLFDAAFNFVCSRDKRLLAQHDGASVFHQTVSDCLDVLELLFGWTQTTPVEIEIWSPEHDLTPLDNQQMDGQRLLASVLRLFLQQDAETARFNLQPSFILLTVARQVIAASSPLTFFITSPRAGEIARANNLLNPSLGRSFFGEPRPLHVRPADFQLYVHWLFSRYPSLRISSRRMYAYTVQSLEILDRTDRSLAKQIRELEHGGAAQLQAALELFTDRRGKPLTVCGEELYKRPVNGTIGRISISSQALKSKQLPKDTLPPILLEEQHNSFGKHDPALVIPDVARILPEDRILPDLGVKYPFLVAEDFIEDRIVRLPFKLNADRFFVPQCEGFKPEEDESFLLPLKPAFFRYFAPADTAAMARLVKKQDGISFELTLPALGKQVTFRKTFYKKPQLARLGTIVDAHLNCAIFPFVVVPERQEFNARYFVMLIDAEIDPVSRTQDCFDLKFYTHSDGKRLLIPEDDSAPHHRHKTRRSSKSVEAGSTYFEITGGHFDYIQVEAFAFDPDRRASAFIVPRWNTHPIGTKKATVAVDFGTTNTHVAWTYDDTPLPKTLTIDSNDLQMVLLSAPRDGAPTESARFDKLVGRLAGTEIRLQHEFLPGIINAISPFRFPLRTATSERPNLQPGEYRTLRNVNISFSFEMTARRPDELISTDLKWSLRASDTVLKRVESFIDELLLIIRTKLILNDADPSIARLVWFRPLSFDDYTKSAFERMWASAVTKSFLIPEDRLKDHLVCMTESEAPYYYHECAADVISTKPVICADIGGGSTDIVFFDQNVPRIGISFSFAGNALWGSGYDKVRPQQTGVVGKYGKWIEQRIQQITNEEERTRINSVHKDLVDSQVPSEELINFFFSIDKHVSFTQQLSRDPGIKCLILIHYAAIVFYSAQVMQSLKMPAPEYICFSGRGAQSIGILDVSPAKRQISSLTHRIFEEVYPGKITEPVKLILAGDSKEATCNGGMLKRTNGTVELKSVVSIGDGSVRQNDLKYRYKDLNSTMINSVVDNINKFIDCLIKLNKTDSFREQFGITMDFNAVTVAMRRKIGDYIDFGLARHGYKDHPSEAINETLFFYPLAQKLYELGNQFITADPAARDGQ